MKKKIVIIGSSGHSKVIIDIIEKEDKYNIVGLIDAFNDKEDTLFRYKILGSEENLGEIIDHYNVYGCFIAIGDNFLRSKVKNKVDNLNRDLKYINAIHPSASIGKNVRIGFGNCIMAHTNIGSNSNIGSFCIVNSNSSIDHDSTMKDFSSIAPGVIAGGNVSIDEFSAISIGATVKHNVKIGKHSIVGASSLVLKDVPDFVVCYGNPSKVIRLRDIGDKYLWITC